MNHDQRNTIYLDCRQYGLSGIGTYIENLTEQYRQIPSALDFHLLVREEHKKQLAHWKDVRISEYNNTIYSIKEQFNWIMKISPRGILHVPHYNAPLLYPGKLIVTVHDVCHLAMKHYFPGVLKRLYSGQFFRQVLVKAEHIITVSEFSKSEIVKYFEIDTAKISVIHNGVAPRFHPLPASEAEQLLKPYRLPQEYMLYVGNIKPHKNISGMLSGYLKACQQVSGLPPLVVLGNNTRMREDIPELNALLRDERVRRKVIFTGFLPNNVLPAVYSKASLFLFPSFYEGFGLTVLEAMACGTPVITSNCTAIPEVVQEAAILINPYDDDELAEQIINLSANSELQRDLINRGLKQAQSYSWEKSAKKHLEVYNRVVESLAPTRTAPVKPAAIQETKNILFLDQYGDRIGGGQVILLDILKRFRSSGRWRVFVSIPEEGKFANLLADNGFEVSVVKMWQPAWRDKVRITDMSKYILSSIKSSYYIGKLIRKQNIKAIYCNGGRTFLNGTFLSLLFSLKLFFHLHLLLEDKQKRAVTILGRTPGVKSIFAVSHLLESQYMNHTIQKKICVVSNWVSPELLTAEPRLQPDTLQKPIRIGIVGQISFMKGQWAVLETLRKLDDVLPMSLSLYGEPLQQDFDHWQELLLMIEDLKAKGWDIRYQGFQTNKLKIYDHLDVLLIPSLVPESFGLTAIEAMARGVIVVANRSGALVEIIEDHVNGLLYNAQDPSDLVNILHSLTNGEMDVCRIRENGAETVRSKYHPEKQLDLLHQTVYQAVYGDE